MCDDSVLTQNRPLQIIGFAAMTNCFVWGSTGNRSRFQHPEANFWSAEASLLIYDGD
jgi:hypothetical protein